MSTQKEEAELVDWFSKAMLEELSKNRWKSHWHELSFDHLLHRLREEACKLRRNYNQVPLDPAAVLREAADVANFAAFIADNVRRAAIKETQ